ncbi:MAG: RNA methyltransferase, partial [Lentisphaerae bacterium]|nr:RNA methyltransferase [Lentisphaerota bacterium]
MEYSKVRNKEEKQQWKTALRLLRDIEPVLSDPKKSAGLIQKAKAFFENSSVDRLRKLARILTEGMDAKQLLCAIVPVERVAARERVTDADMKLVSHDAASAPAASDVLPLILVADNIRSAVNIGGMFRTLEFFNAQAVW